MGELIPTLFAAVGSMFGITLKYLSPNRGSRAFRNILRHASLLDSLPVEARSELRKLITLETNQYASRKLISLEAKLNPSGMSKSSLRKLKRSQRKLDGGNLAVLILVAALTSGVVYGLSLGAIGLGSWGTPLGVIVWIVTYLVAVFGVLLSFAGVSQLYNYPAESAKRKE